MVKKVAEHDNKASPEVKRKAQVRTVSGFSRFLYGMNLMLEVAAAQSTHGLTRHETLLLSIFRNGNDHPHSLKIVDREFRKLLVVGPKNPMVTKTLEAAVAGLIEKGLLQSVRRGNAVQITPDGQTELGRISDVIDTMWDRLTNDLAEPDRATLRNLIKKIDP